MLQARTEYEANLFQDYSSNCKAIYRYLNLISSSSTIPNQVNFKSISATTPLDKANLFNQLKKTTKFACLQASCTMLRVSNMCSFCHSFCLSTALQRAAFTSSRQLRNEQAKYVDGLQCDGWILLNAFVLEFFSFFLS